MKFVLLALLIAAVIWWLRGARRVGKPPAGTPPAPPASEAPVMVACAHCGVHLPRAEALTGPDGVFCSEAHRAAGRGAA